ncbi:MAG TPA: hypothetical protein VNK41_07610 [Vicinamibacterales bacterium]|nr:hypothetical protein [Vicinamibacterales bacterium]
MSRRCPGIVALVLLAAAAGCAKPRLQLPSGSSAPLANPAAVLDEAFGHCAGLRSVSLVISLSGRAGREKLRGRLIAGLARPESIRLDAVAPFGAPAFILAASGRDSVLLLPRDDRVLLGAPPHQILEALAGVDVRPGDLLAFLGGCPASAPVPASARAFGTEWAAFDLEDGAVAYVRRVPAWRAAAVVRPRLRVVFEEWSNTHPAQVRLHNTNAERGAGFDLLLKLSQVETNVALPPDAFAVDVPPDAEPITLEELRRAGPMRDASAAPES